MSVGLNRRSLLGAGAGMLALPHLGRASLSAPMFRRGVSIHNLLNWAEVEPNDKNTYRWPPFQSVHHQMQSALYGNIVAAGFDFVRLTIDSGLFLQITGERRNVLDEILVKAIKTFQSHGLGVVVDFHGNSQVPAYAPLRITESLSSPLFEAYSVMLVRTAKLLSVFKGTRIALELMNEPQWGWDASSAARWQTMQQLWHDRVRAANPDLTLVLTGARGGNAAGLMLIDAKPFAGSDVLWSFHYYEPYELTHQGVKFDSPKSRSWRYFSDLPYPAAPEHYELIWPIIERNIKADSSLAADLRETLIGEARDSLKRYLDARPGRATVKRDFEAVTDWTKRFSIPTNRLFLGEFGITRTYGRYRASPPGPLSHWLFDVREEAEARNIGWALWALSGYGGMALVETDESVSFDKPTIAALGLKG